MDMTHVLDAVISGETPRADYSSRLELPRPQGWERGRVWARWTVGPDYLTPWGAVFGGYIAAVADEFAGMAALSVLEPGVRFGTSDLRISLMRALRPGVVEIDARVLSHGRSAVHVEVDFVRQDGSLAVRVSATQVLAHG